jgi:hypothetical protein
MSIHLTLQHAPQVPRIPMINMAQPKPINATATWSRPGICLTKSPRRSKKSGPTFKRAPTTIRAKPTSYKILMEYHVRFGFTFNCLIYVICVCLRIVVSTTHIVLCFLLCFAWSCVPMLPVSLDCSFLIASSVFSNVYLVVYLVVRFSLILY